MLRRQWSLSLLVVITASHLRKLLSVAECSKRSMDFATDANTSCVTSSASSTLSPERRQTPTWCRIRRTTSRLPTVPTTSRWTVTIHGSRSVRWSRCRPRCGKLSFTRGWTVHAPQAARHGLAWATRPAVVAACFGHARQRADHRWHLWRRSVRFRAERDSLSGTVPAAGRLCGS